MESPLWEIPQLAETGARSPVQLLKELSLIVGAAIVATLIIHSGAPQALLSEGEISSALAVLAGALALATAAMWHMVRRLTGDGRATLCGAAMALYALVAVPTTTLGSVPGAQGPLGAARLASHLVVVALLLGCSTAAMTRWHTGSRTLLGAGLLVVLGAGVIDFVDPPGALAVSEAPELRWLIVVGWVIAGIRVTRHAFRLGPGPSVRVGLGLILLAVAHGYRLTTEAAQPDGHPSLTFGTLRLVALWFIGLGSLRFGTRALHGLSEQQRQWRQHHTDPVVVGPPVGKDAFEVGPTVGATVALHRATGLNVRCEIPPGLVARGSREMLSQVLTHLLTNCSWHAPQSPVTVWARADGERVVLRVSDEGPGVADGIQAALFEHGARGPGSHGRGLGLYLCRELLSEHGGDIRLHRSGSNVGCTIQVELPVAVDVPGLGTSTDPEPGDGSGATVGSTSSAVMLPRWTTRMASLVVPVARQAVGLASGPRARRTGRFQALPSVGASVSLLIVAFAVCQIPPVSAALSLKAVGVSLALVAVAGGVLSAFACAVLGQLADEPAGFWLGAGLMFYSVIGIPVATFSADSSDSEAAAGNLRVLAHAIFIVLTLTAVFAARRPLRDGWVALAIGSALSVAAAGLGIEFPAQSLAVTANETARYVFCGCWLVSGLVLFVCGCGRRWSWMSWAGIGITVIAIAHTYRVITGSPFIPLDATFSAVRLLGVLLLATGALPAARRVLVEANAARQQQLAELERAQTGLQDFAQREHEIRNGLAGLANVAVLLESDSRRPDEWDALRAAATAEIERLTVLLRPDGADVQARPYDVLPVLRERLALQTNAETDVRVDVEPNLRAVGNPLVLSQVLANVLANWQRHAPGSPLRIQAVRRAEFVVLRVCDFGPGVAGGIGGHAFELGVRGPASTGQGFGLHICRQLLEGESGQIHLMPRPVTGTGCTVIIEVPAAPMDGSGYPELAGRSTG